MADKFLSEAEWKKFAKGRDLRDAALLKALVAYEKAKRADEQLDALAAIEREIDGLRKYVKGDREFGAQLDAMEKGLAKEEKAARASAKESESSEAEEEESPTLLTTKLVPLLRELRKGEVEMPMLAAVGAKEAAVLISRRAISPSKRKMLAEYLGESGTPKYVAGHCVWESGSYTFVVQTQAAGLAKKLRAALLKQAEMRVKVRVRGEDGDIDDDGEEVQEREQEDEGDLTPGADTQALKPTAGLPPPAPPLPPDPLKKKFDERLAALTPQLLAALREGIGDTGKIRAVVEFARGKGEAAQFQSGLQALDSLDKLLNQTSAPKADGPDPAPAFNARLAALLGRAKPHIATGGEQGQTIKAKLSEAGLAARKHDYTAAHALLDQADGLLEIAGETPESESQEQQTAGTGLAAGARVAFTQSRLDWDRTRKFVQAELKKLDAAILAQSTEEEDFDTIRAGTANLYTILDVLDERLIDKLDEALNAEPDQRGALNGEAVEIIKEYLAFVDNEPLMQDIDDSGFLNLTIRSTLTTQLKNMSEKLGATMARA